MSSCGPCKIPLYIVSIILGGFVIASLIALCVLLIYRCRNRRNRADYERFGNGGKNRGSQQTQIELSDKLKDEKKRNDTLEADLKKEKDDKEDALRRLTHLEETITSLRDEVKKKEDKNRALEADLKKERDDKDDALKRLSAIMSSRLRDGNPNVVDLSDQNRPLKVGEQFSELYDNQWTDAFSVVKEKVKDTEDRVISMLVEILEECFKTCQTAAADQLSLLRSNVKAITEMVTKKESKLPEDLMQRIKEERKMNAIDNLPEYYHVTNKIKEYLNNHGIQDATFIDDPIVEAYIRECIKLCYLMVNQDPPMAIVSRPDQNAGENFKAYQHRGSRILFVVWPALYLQEGGPLVSKGVAEFGE